MLLFCWKPSKSFSLISEENLKSWLWLTRPSMIQTLHLYDLSSDRASPHTESALAPGPLVNSEHTKYAVSSFSCLRFPEGPSVRDLHGFLRLVLLTLSEEGFSDEPGK